MMTITTDLGISYCFKEFPTQFTWFSFDVVSKAMSIYPTVDLEELPRMADFAKWGYAIAEALGNRGNEFIEDYSLDEAERVRETIDANPFASAVIELLKISPDWEGHPTELLTRLENVAESNKINMDAKMWPKSANWVTRRLHEIKPFIVKEGFSYKEKKTATSRTIKFHKGGKNVVTDVIAVTDDGDKSDNDNKIPTTRETDAGISQFWFKENETQIIALREEEKKAPPRSQS